MSDVGLRRRSERREEQSPDRLIISQLNEFLELQMRVQTISDDPNRSTVEVIRARRDLERAFSTFRDTCVRHGMLLVQMAEFFSPQEWGQSPEEARQIIGLIRSIASQPGSTFSVQYLPAYEPTGPAADQNRFVLSVTGRDGRTVPLMVFYMGCSDLIAFYPSQEIYDLIDQGRDYRYIPIRRDQMEK